MTDRLQTLVQHQFGQRNIAKESTIADLFDRTGNLDALDTGDRCEVLVIIGIPSVIALPKRGHTDLFHALGDGDVFQLKTHFKRTLRNHLQRGRNGNAFQIFTIGEHTHAHLSQTFGQNDLFHTKDCAESIITDALQFGRQLDAFKRESGIVVVNVFAAKGCFTDVGDTVIQYNTSIVSFVPRGRVLYRVPLVIHYQVAFVIILITIVIHGAISLDIQGIAIKAPGQIGTAAAAGFVSGKYGKRHQLQQHDAAEHQR